MVCAPAAPEAAGTKRKRAPEAEQPAAAKRAPAAPSRPGMSYDDWCDLEGRHSELTGIAPLVCEFE